MYYLVILLTVLYFTALCPCICYHGDILVVLQPLYPVESVVDSVREETEKVAEKILSEQVKDHQNFQSIGEEWMQDTAKVTTTLLLLLKTGTNISDFVIIAKFCPR